MNNKTTIYYISAILNLVLLVVLSIVWVSSLTGKYYINDGNIWRIYKEGFHLLIGDFWVSVFIIWYPFKGIDFFLNSINERLDTILKLEKDD